MGRRLAPAPPAHGLRAIIRGGQGYGSPVGPRAPPCPPSGSDYLRRAGVRVAGSPRLAVVRRATDCILRGLGPWGGWAYRRPAARPRAIVEWGRRHVAGLAEPAGSASGSRRRTRAVAVPRPPPRVGRTGDRRSPAPGPRRC